MQILAVNGISLLTLPYRESLQILQKTGNIVELTLSQIQPSVRTQRYSKAEKDLTVESFEQSQNRKQHQRTYHSNVDYLKHIRYETNDISQIDSAETKFIQLADDNNSRSNILIASKSMPDLPKVHLIEIFNYKWLIFFLFIFLQVIATLPKNFNELFDNKMTSTTAMPKTMGLSRRYLGPVKYPVTPIRVSLGTEKQRLSLLVDENDKHVFI